MKSFLILALASAALLAGCGGGGDNAGSPPPTVASASISTSTPKYSDDVTITLLGTNLDQTLNFSGSGCRNYTRLTTAPTASSATVAYYRCTVSGVGAQTVSVSSAAVLGGPLATVAFNAPVPQVTMLITNGAAVSGQIVITLAPEQTPRTVDNFLAYVKSGFYTDTVFHRHGRNGDRFGNPTGEFVLQGGGYTAPVAAATRFLAPKATNAPIALERGLSNLRYTVAMAPTDVLNSATSEFFINTVDNTFLDPPALPAAGGYAAFGTITLGTTLVDAMVAAPCNFSSVNFGLNSPDCVPEPNLVIASAQQTR